jgi:hypothetical protein
VSRVLGQLVGFVGQVERPGGLVLRLLSLLGRLLRCFLSQLCALVGLVGFVLSLLRLLSRLVGLVVRLQRGLVGLIGLVLRLPGRVVRLLRPALRLLCLLTRAMRLVQGQLDTVPNSLQVLADVLSGRQLPQFVFVLMPVRLTVLTSGLRRRLYIVCLGHDVLLGVLFADFLAPESISAVRRIAPGDNQVEPHSGANQHLDSA